MSLNVLHFKHDGRAQWGVIHGGRITPVPGAFETTGAFLAANSIDTLSRLSGTTLQEADVDLLSPVTQNQQFLCQGANYRQHMIESGMDPDAKTFIKKGKRARRGPSRSAALNAALRSAIESYIVAVADRAAEAVEDSWRADPAGAVLLADAAAERARDVRAKQVFESVFGPAGQSGGGDPADADIKAADMIKAADAAQASAFSRSSPDLALRATRAIGAWQDHLTRLVEGEDLRPAAARRISFDEEALSLVVLVAMLGEAVPAGTVPARTGPAGIGPARTGPPGIGPAGTGPAGIGPARTGPAGTVPARTGPPGIGPARTGPPGTGPRPAGAAVSAEVDGGVYTEPRRMLTSVFAGVMVTEILAKARADLLNRVRLLLDEELVRFVEVLDAAGACDDVAAIRLYQAEFSLEAVR